jgi:hypothetical protein
MTRHTFPFIGLAAAAACSWGRFDDLKHDTGVDLAEKPSAVTGTVGVAVGAVQTLGTTEAAAFVASATTPTGLVRFSIAPSGDIGSDGHESQGSGGDLSPIRPTNTPQSIVAFGDAKFVVGVPSSKQVVAFDNATAGFAGSGDALVTPDNVLEQTGLAIAVGALPGVGDATDDIVVVAETRVYVIPDGDPAKQVTVCALRQPLSTFSLGNGTVSVRNVAIASIDGSNKIVVGGAPFSGQGGQVTIMDAPTSTDTTGTSPPACTGGFVTGTTDLDAPFALAVGDLDGNGGRNDIVTASQLQTSGSNPTKVCIYLNVTTSGSPTCTEIAKPDTMASIQSSSLRGARLLITQLENSTTPMIVVGDPNAIVETKSAGAVSVYTFSGGTATLSAALWVAGPDGSENFGRDLTGLPFTAGGKTTNILAVGMKDKVALYFKVHPSAADPRTQ